MSYHEGKNHSLVWVILRPPRAPAHRNRTRNRRARGLEMVALGKSWAAHEAAKCPGPRNHPPAKRANPIHSPCAASSRARNSSASNPQDRNPRALGSLPSETETCWNALRWKGVVGQGRWAEAGKQTQTQWSIRSPGKGFFQSRILQDQVGWEVFPGSTGFGTLTSVT